MIRHSTELLKIDKHLPGLQSLYVDEYQDINPAQVSLMKAMLLEKSRIIAVGDDLQCIYNWRGSDVSRILNFRKDFNENGVFRLKSNYRSRPGIVRFGNAISIKIDMRDKEKIMRESRGDVGVNTVEWINSSSEEDQSLTVINTIQKFLSNGVPRKSIAILLRSVVGSGRKIVDALREKKIPVQCPSLHRGGEFINDLVLPLFNWLRMEPKEPRNEIEEKELENKLIRSG